MGCRTLLLEIYEILLCWTLSLLLVLLPATEHMIRIILRGLPNTDEEMPIACYLVQKFSLSLRRERLRQQEQLQQVAPVWL